MTSDQTDLVVHFLRQGDWPQAVAYYREETGVDVVTANEAVQVVAERFGIQRRWNWLRLSFVVAGLTLVAFCIRYVS